MWSDPVNLFDPEGTAIPMVVPFAIHASTRGYQAYRAYRAARAAAQASAWANEIGDGDAEESDFENDDSGDYADEEAKNTGRKGECFRGGNKKQRDKWYGKDNKDFKKWWHRQGKKEFNDGLDIEDAQNAQDAFDYWESIGRPKVK